VTQQKTCERLLRKALDYKNQHTGLHVIHVAKNNWNFLDNTREGEALEYLFSISKAIGAELTVLRSEEIVDAIVDYAVVKKIDLIIMGQSPSDHLENNFYAALRKRLNSTEIMSVPYN
jgi:K+-sensing histidine kinase KdpD